MKKDETSRLYPLFLEDRISIRVSRVDTKRIVTNGIERTNFKETSGNITSILILLQTIFKHELNSNLKPRKFKIYSPSFYFFYLIFIYFAKN